SLSPWRTRISVPAILPPSCGEAEHVGHGIEPGSLVPRPERGAHGALREQRPVIGIVPELEALGGPREDHRVFADDIAAAQRGKTDRPRLARPGLSVASAHGMGGE